MEPITTRVNIKYVAPVNLTVRDAIQFFHSAKYIHYMREHFLIPLAKRAPTSGAYLAALLDSPSSPTTKNHGHECVICMESRPSQLVLPCGHAFHPECIQPWLAEHSNCPTCRHQLPREDSYFHLQKIDTKLILPSFTRGIEKAELLNTNVAHHTVLVMVKATIVSNARAGAKNICANVSLVEAVFVKSPKRARQDEQDGNQTKKFATVKEAL